MIEPSKAELIRQINREGKRWGLSHTISPWGDVLVAEEIPCKLELGNGISIVEKVKRPITAMSTSYPFSSILRNRFKLEDRKQFLGLEIRHETEKREHESKMEAMHHELEMDIRKADKGRIIIGGK